MSNVRGFDVKRIKLIWHFKRLNVSIVIGFINKKSSGEVWFYYDEKGINDAKKYGFDHYPGFFYTEKIYNLNVLDIFGMRLPKSSRMDLDDFYEYWQVDISKKEDVFYMLAATHAITPTDSFEFIPDFNIEKN